MLFVSPNLWRYSPAVTLPGRCLRKIIRRCTTLASAQEGVVHVIQHGRALVRQAVLESVRLSEADIAVDATCGRGSDTITLARALGNSGTVYAMDIQRDAIAETVTRYEQIAKQESLAKLVPMCRSHEDLAVLGLKPLSVAAVVYNLGWYPANGADRSIITKTDTTVNSLESALRFVKKCGAVIVTTYVGHDGGQEEALAVDKWVSQLNSKTWSCAFVQFPNRVAAPSVHVIVRQRDE